MKNIVIVAIGKIKEASYRDLCAEYVKRLRPYVKVEIAEIKPEPFGAGDKQRAKSREGDRLLDFLAKYESAQVYLLDEHGKEFTSVDFAKFLDKKNETLILVIGGTLGFAPEVSNKYKNKIALSQFTLLHELTRVVLLEQIYRAVTIIKGKEYHY
ncbi:MAG: 23S rRNA (pseudouridine(1915)-N(3))-methyltransferase RlmH [Patescibacteria group bacterium]|jgi:23S rRNA (pseudouridine1915-N3)-methyltransferase